MDKPKEEKIKEIAEQYPINTFTGETKKELLEVIKEYGQWVGQQKLEEAIASVSPKWEGIKSAFEEGSEFSTPRMYRAEGWNDCRQQTLSNLQALKDKNK